MKIGYCPTMEEYVKKIKNIQDFELINLGSAGRALFFLSNGEIDIAVIGRKAKKREFEGYEKVIGEGYTLITNSKSFISKDDITNIKVDTNVPEDIVEKEFPELENVIYHKTLQDALSNGNIQLISWNDWNDEFELLIPINEFNNKIKKFRVPHFYSKKDILNNSIK